MRKAPVAFVVGLASFFPWMFLGEEVGLLPAFVFLTAYYFVAQLLLSRGKARAYGTDWATMLALDASSFLMAIISGAVENRSVLLSQSLPLLLCTAAGTYTGALAASLAARRRWPLVRARADRPNALVVGAGACVFGSATFAFTAVPGTMLARTTMPLHAWWLGAAIACAGGTLGCALGAHLADRRQGRFPLVVGVSLAVGTLAWAAWLLARAFHLIEQSSLLVFLVGIAAVLVTAVEVERRTAVGGTSSPVARSEVGPAR